MRYAPKLEIRLCRLCSNSLYNSKKKIAERECGGVTITVDLCSNCVDWNIAIKDVFYEYNDKK
ncbi:hypothetical protein Mgra_00001007 [Meloidogyne graminicola]|uniref:Uncharacterized protein n=1 Tax=Meloidogyne graminicola TaxID=189291 RepID=A0A8T0A406_9BILA|nr:hypothetical protein Mgra_00001007 [Meloidogyne graminicola]